MLLSYTGFAYILLKKICIMIEALIKMMVEKQKQGTKRAKKVERCWCRMHRCLNVLQMLVRVRSS